MEKEINLFSDVKHLTIRHADFATRPKFTFVTPTYNRLHLLKYSLDSILKQIGDEQCEVLIGDNNPERGNDTEQYISTLKDARISYYKYEKNIGSAGNWTKICQLAQGEWIIMLHDDDMLYPDFFACLKRTMAEYGDKVVGIFPTFNSAAFEGTAQPERKRHDIAVRYIQLEDFLEGCVLACPIGMCIKKEAFDRVKGFDPDAIPSIDYEFYVRLIQEGAIVKQYDYPTATWRIMQNDSMNKSVMLDCVRQVTEIQDRIIAIQHKQWLKPWLKRRNRAFHNQHVRFWYDEIRHTEPEPQDLVDASWLDGLVYRLFRIYFVLHRHLRRGGKTIRL